MPRKRLQISDTFPYHVHGRCSNQEWFQIPLDDVWLIMTNYLFFISHAYGVEIIAFVLMNNHFHLLIRTPNGNIHRAMNYFMRETSKAIGRICGRKNQIWGGPYKWSLIADQAYFYTAYRYLYLNPVRAKIVEQVEKYPYSSLPFLMGIASQPLSFPCFAMDELFLNTEDHLKWLNENFSESENTAIRNGLNKKVFELGKDKNGKRFELKSL